MHLRGKDYDQSKALAPIGLGYLASYLEKHLGFTDVIIEVDDPDKLLRHNPDIIGISSFTETFEEVIQHSRYLKRVAPSLPIIVGGEHISALPESLPETIDIGVVGEGEETLAELMQLFLKGEANPDHLGKIDGLVYRHKGELIQTNPRNWIMDLDQIPPPKRELLHRGDEVWQQSIFTARGCPYKCTFCASTKFWQKTRYHSVQRVMEDIQSIVDLFPNQPLISINDDLFPLNKKRMHEMVKAIRARGLHKKVGFTLNARASVFDEEIAQLIAAMNGQVVCFGFESGSDKILKLLKGKTSVQENQQALDLCEKYGFAVVGNFMTCSPEETPVDMAKTYWFLRSNAHKIWRPNICFSTPFPGTEFWEEAVERNLFEENFGRWDILDLGFKRGESIYMNKHVTPEAFEPMYEYFVSNNKKVDDLRSDFYQMKVKRDYLYNLYHKLIARYPDTIGQALEISNEGLHLQQVLEQDTITRIETTDGQVDWTSIGEQTFPLVILNHTLERHRNPSELIQQALAHLSPGGELVCLSYNAYHVSLLLELLIGRWEPQKFGIYQFPHLRVLTIDSLVKLLQQHGLELQQVEKTRYEADHFQPMIEKLKPLLAESFDLSRWLKSCDAFGAMVVARPVAIEAVPVVTDERIPVGGGTH